MSLVRHMVAPPVGTATADTDPFDFDLAVNPDPLRISPSSGDPARGDLIVVTSLASQAPVECRSFTVTLKLGPGEDDLCSSLSGVTGHISLAGWTATVNEAARTLTFAPGQGAPAHTEFGPEAGVTFQVMGLPVNQRVGLSQVDIGAAWRAPGTTDWKQQTTRLQVGKFPLGFHLRSFVAEPHSVANGDSVTLRWDASGATHLSLYYDGEVHPVTGETSVTVPGLKQTTFFHLRAVAQDGAGSVERTLSVMVHVSTPELTVCRVIVHGTLQAGRISPVTGGSPPVVFPQRLPTVPDGLLAADGPGWQDSHWIPSALPVGTLALFSHTTGQSTQSSLKPYVELIYQPFVGSDLVWSSFDGYAWTRMEEPFGPGADPSIAIKNTLLWPLLWAAYRGGANNTQVMTRMINVHGLWNAPEPAPGGVTTRFRPALADRKGTMLYLAATDRTDAPPLYWLRRQEEWSSPLRLPGDAATGAPALAAFRDIVVCVFPSSDRFQVVYELTGRPNADEEWVTGPGLLLLPRPAGPPSLAVHNDRLYCAYRDDSNRAQLMSYDGTTWTSPSQVSDRIYTHNPALLATGGRLWLL
ncbi:hypothetical protein ACFVW1_17145 [Streptomyces olivochromogenes]|uniref:hypothetical protein n=1 Tax=Streptomyces olivochromogenes TaxID=1963 RepID=UPI0036DF017D